MNIPIPPSPAGVSIAATSVYIDPADPASAAAVIGPITFSAIAIG